MFLCGDSIKLLYLRIIFQDRPRKNESVLGNMKQYGLGSKYVDVVVADASLPLWKAPLQFDAIITDR